VWKRGECYVQKILKVNKTVVDYRADPWISKRKIINLIAEISKYFHFKVLKDIYRFNIFMVSNIFTIPNLSDSQSISSS
jgi:hypothetical protein